ncbi:PcsB-like coiled-coil domain-containing protein [Oceanobacillus sp. CAU 1775]
MRNKLTTLILIASVLMISGFFPKLSFAESTDDLQDIQKERQAIQQNLSAEEQKLKQLLDEMKQLDEQVETLHIQVEQKQEAVNKITTEIDETVEEISELQLEIKRLEESIADRFELLKTRAASYQQSGGGINFLEVLFGSQSFGDFISRLTAVNQIADSDARLMEQLDEDIKLVETHQLTTVEKLNELNAMYDDQQEQLVALNAEKEQQENSKKKLSNIQQEIIAYMSDLETKDKSLQTMEQEVKDEIAAAKAEKARVAEEKAKEAEARELAKAEEKKKQSNLVQVAKKQEKTQVQSPAPKKNKEVNEKEQVKNSFTVTSTAYTANCAGCSGITSTGINLNKNPNQKVIAVDPSVIPLGSVVYVEGYGYAIAGDTGGAIRGNKIDVFVKTKAEALNWGVRTVRVTIQ